MVALIITKQNIDEGSLTELLTIEYIFGRLATFIATWSQFNLNKLPCNWAENYLSPTSPGAWVRTSLAADQSAPSGGLQWTNQRPAAESHWPMRSQRAGSRALRGLAPGREGESRISLPLIVIKLPPTERRHAADQKTLASQLRDI